MIIYDQIRVSDDGKNLFINAHVNKAEMFEDTTIEKLYICTGNQVYETLTIDPESNGYIYKKEYNNVKEINEVISINDDSLIYNKDSFSKDLFFVYIKCAGIPEEACCFTVIGNYVLGVTFDENILYQKAMDFTKDLTKDCQIPSEFIDFILLWNAFKASVETEHFIPAIKYWKMLFDNTGTSSMNGTKNCGCHG